MKKNVGLVNYRVSFKCKFNKYVYEATNILFTFENRGGALKQTENRSLQTLLVMVLYQKQHTMFMKQQTRDLLLKIAEVV